MHRRRTPLSFRRIRRPPLPGSCTALHVRIRQTVTPALTMRIILSREKRRRNHGSDGSFVALLKLLLLVEENCYPFAPFYS
jgi:hypothetical protein